MNRNSRYFGKSATVELLDRPTMRVYAVNITDIFQPAQTIDSPAMLINTLLPNLYLLAGIIVFLLFIGGGFMMIQGASSGDAQQTGRGRKAVTYAIIGLIVIFGSYLFVQFLTRFTTGESIF